MREYIQRKFANRIMGGKKLRAADTNGLKIVVSEEGNIYLYLWDKNGVMVDETIEVFDVRGVYNSAEELIRAIQSNTKMYYDLEPSDFVFYRGGLKSKTVEQKELGTVEGIRLYNAHLWLPLEVVSDKHSMTKEEAEAFGFSI